MQKISPFLWYDSQAEEAANYYVGIFKNSRIKGVYRFDEESAKSAGKPANSVMTVDFVLDGEEFTAINGGPMYKFTHAVSFVINCEDQEEVDYYWAKLTAGGNEVACGWLQDKFGLSWQVVPTIYFKLLDGEPEKVKKMNKAMLNMMKLDIAGLLAAYNGD